jgi:hypothetical protein
VNYNLLLPQAIHGLLSDSATLPSFSGSPWALMAEARLYSSLSTTLDEAFTRDSDP